MVQLHIDISFEIQRKSSIDFNFNLMPLPGLIHILNLANSLCKLKIVNHHNVLFKVLLLVYKAINVMAPLYITELLSYRTCSRSLRSTDQNFWQFRSQDLKHTETRPFPLLHLNSGRSCH